MIEARALGVVRGGMLLVRASFKIGAGELILVRGDNGSGKSSLLLTLAGLVAPSGGHPSGGQLFYQKEPCRDLRPDCQLLGAADGLDKTATIGENLRFWRAFFASVGRASAVTIEALCGRWGLPLELRAGDASEGQRRRAALARLELGTQAAWLLDEPERSLDRHACEILNTMVERQLARGGVVMAAVHGASSLAGMAASSLDLVESGTEPASIPASI